MKKLIRKALAKTRYFVNHPIVKYYAKHPIILLKNRTIVFFLKLKKIANRDINFNDKVRSNIPIDVVIPAIDKDYDVLTYVIDSIKKNIKHPIENILIISPESKLIKEICKKKKCIFIDENKVLPITKKDINFVVNGKDRSGWLFQQLLKWGSEKYVKNEYFLVADADTVFCRPQVFIYNNKVVLSVSNQFCHIPYFETYKKLVGVEIKPLRNFTSHHSLFQKNKLTILKKKLEENNKTSWYKAIIDNSVNISEGSSVSDYETYGQFVYSSYPHEFILEHWFNTSVSRSKLSKISEILKENYRKYKTISFHSYSK